MTNITIHQIDHATIKLEFSNAGIARELSDELTFEAHNARFSPLYRAKKWDGKIRLYDSRSGTTLAGLTHDVVEFAERNSYTVDNRTDIGTTTPFSLTEAYDYANTLGLPEHIKVRPEQLLAFAKAVRNRRCVLVSPTASGKSLIAYLIAMYYGKKTLIVVPTISLVSQMIKNFEEYGYKGQVHGVMAGVTKSTNLNITVSTWQSVYEQPASFFKDFKVIIGDEAHTFKAKSLSAIMNNMKHTPHRFGMTGTLDGSEVNELTLKGLFGTIERVVTTKALIDNKTLADIKIKILLLKHDQASRRHLSGASYMDELEFITEHDYRNKFIRNLALSLQGNTLVLFARVERHGKVLYDLIHERHDETHYVSGKTESEIREQIRQYVNKSDNSIIVASYGVFSTGINIPRIHNIIFASPSKSRIRVLQSIGRGLRRGEDKDSFTLFDIADDLSYQNKRNYTLNHMIERVKMYNSEGFPYESHTIEIRSNLNDSTLF